MPKTNIRGGNKRKKGKNGTDEVNRTLDLAADDQIYGHVSKVLGGGNFLVLSTNRKSCLSACETAINAIKNQPNIITPFPGGVVRSGSKVGSKYKALIASTNDAFCPTLKSITKSTLPANVNCVMEIVINGLTFDDINEAIKTSIQSVLHGFYELSDGMK